MLKNFGNYSYDFLHFYLFKPTGTKKARFCSKKFLENCFLWSRYGVRTRAGTGTSQKSEPEPELVKSRNRNSKKQLRFRNTAIKNFMFSSREKSALKWNFRKRYCRQKNDSEQSLFRCILGLFQGFVVGETFGIFRCFNVYRVLCSTFNKICKKNSARFPPGFGADSVLDNTVPIFYLHR